MTDESDRGAAIVPAIGVQSSVAAARSLGRKGVDVIAATDTSRRTPLTASKYCTGTASVPSPAESVDDYAQALLDLAGRSDVRSILPLREADVYALAKYRTDFADHVRPVWPAFDVLESVQDRNTLFSIAEEHGVPTPQTWLLTEWPEREAPAVIKSRYSILVDETSSTRYPGVRIVSSASEINTGDVIEEMGHVPLVQEFVPKGGEYGFFALFDRGEPIVTFQHQRIRSASYDGGASVYRRAVEIPELEQHGLELLEALDWHGPAMVEFREDRRDGSFKLMEINPRFWGSLALPIHAGVDFPYYYHQLAIDERPDRSDVEYRASVASHLLKGELLYLFSVLSNDSYEESPSFVRELLSLFGSLYRQPHFDYLSTDDPRPFAADIRNQLRTVLR